jgi:hypothetical protein
MIFSSPGSPALNSRSASLPATGKLLDRKGELERLKKYFFKLALCQYNEMTLRHDRLHIY